MYVIKMNYGKREYVGVSSPNWLDLLNDTVTMKKYATKFKTKKQAEDFMYKLIADSPSDCFDRFSVVRF